MMLEVFKKLLVRELKQRNADKCVKCQDTSLNAAVILKMDELCTFFQNNIGTQKSH